ncbi:MAG: TlpA disulfide reductase family protein [Ferruginibacter sp.]
MKKILASFICVISMQLLYAQSDSSAPYRKNPQLPAFSLMANDSTSFRLETRVAPGKPTLLMLFNPDCGHCQKQFEVLTADPDLARHMQVVLVSVTSLKLNREFAAKYHVENFPFIAMGQDYKGVFGNFFQPRTIPTLVLYDGNGQFAAIHYGNMEKKELDDFLAKAR